jgi:hypothetical protein
MINKKIESYPIIYPVGQLLTIDIGAIMEAKPLKQQILSVKYWFSSVETGKLNLRYHCQLTRIFGGVNGLFQA